MLINFAKTIANDLTKERRPSHVTLGVGYTPTDWGKTINQEGIPVYNDRKLNTLVVNLSTINQILADLRERAIGDLNGELNRNLGAPTIKDPTVERVGWVFSKMIECIALAFPAGTTSAVVSGFICRLVSGGLQNLTKTNIADPDYQQSINQLSAAVEKYFGDLIQLVGTWIQEPKNYWTVSYKDDLNKQAITLAEVADHDQFLPKKLFDPLYDTWFTSLSKLAKSVMVQYLLPVNYRIRSYGTSFQQDETEYSAYWFWNVKWIEVRNSSTWNRWRSRSDWPKIPDDMKNDLAGPHEDIGSWQNIKGGHQYYQSTNGDGKVVLNAAIWDDNQYWWTRRSDSRWMYYGGRNCTQWDAKKQGNTCNYEQKNETLAKGTPFLDYIDDIVNNRGSFKICRDPSVLAYYELKDPGSGKILINSRRVDLMTSTDGCKDYFYQINWTRWNWCYIGIQIKFLGLVDSRGNRINETTAKWLFKDDGHGNIINPAGIASRLDVFFNWNLSKI